MKKIIYLIILFQIGILNAQDGLNFFEGRYRIKGIKEQAVCPENILIRTDEDLVLVEDLSAECRDNPELRKCVFMKFSKIGAPSQNYRWQDGLINHKSKSETTLRKNKIKHQFKEKYRFILFPFWLTNEHQVRTMRLKKGKLRIVNNRKRVRKRRGKKLVCNYLKVSETQEMQ